MVLMETNVQMLCVMQIIGSYTFQPLKVSDIMYQCSVCLHHMSCSVSQDSSGKSGEGVFSSGASTPSVAESKVCSLFFFIPKIL